MKQKKKRWTTNRSLRSVCCYKLFPAQANKCELAKLPTLPPKAFHWKNINAAEVQSLSCWKFAGTFILDEVIWLVVLTHLKNISQNENLPQIGMNIKKIFETTT